MKNLPNIITQPHYTKPIPNKCLVIDNGTYAVKAGYQGYNPQIIFQNCFYKTKNYCFLTKEQQTTFKTMFENDVIINAENFEIVIDFILNYLIFEYKGPNSLISMDEMRLNEAEIKNLDQKINDSGHVSNENNKKRKVEATFRDSKNVQESGEKVEEQKMTSKTNINTKNTKRKASKHIKTEDSSSNSIDLSNTEDNKKVFKEEKISHKVSKNPKKKEFAKTKKITASTKKKQNISSESSINYVSEHSEKSFSRKKIKKQSAQKILKNIRKSALETTSSDVSTSSKNPEYEISDSGDINNHKNNKNRKKERKVPSSQDVSNEKIHSDQVVNKIKKNMDKEKLTKELKNNQSKRRSYRNMIITSDEETDHSISSTENARSHSLNCFNYSNNRVFCDSDSFYTEDSYDYLTSYPVYKNKIYQNEESNIICENSKEFDTKSRKLSLSTSTVNHITILEINDEKSMDKNNLENNSNGFFKKNLTLQRNITKFASSNKISNPNQRSFNKLTTKNYLEKEKGMNSSSESISDVQNEKFFAQKLTQKEIENYKSKVPTELILTASLYTPKMFQIQKLSLLFDVYKFKRIQIGLDCVYSYFYNISEDIRAKSDPKISLIENKYSIFNRIYEKAFYDVLSNTEKMFLTKFLNNKEEEISSFTTFPILLQNKESSDAGYLTKSILSYYSYDKKENENKKNNQLLENSIHQDKETKTLTSEINSMVSNINNIPKEQNTLSLSTFDSNNMMQNRKGFNFEKFMIYPNKLAPFIYQEIDLIVSIGNTFTLVIAIQNEKILKSYKIPYAYKHAKLCLTNLLFLKDIILTDEEVDDLMEKSEAALNYNEECLKTVENIEKEDVIIDDISYEPEFEEFYEFIDFDAKNLNYLKNIFASEIWFNSFETYKDYHKSFFENTMWYKAEKQNAPSTKTKKYISVDNENIRGNSDIAINQLIDENLKLEKQSKNMSDDNILLENDKSKINFDENIHNKEYNIISEQEQGIKNIGIKKYCIPQQKLNLITNAQISEQKEENVGKETENHDFTLQNIEYLENTAEQNAENIFDAFKNTSRDEVTSDKKTTQINNLNEEKSILDDPVLEASDFSGSIINIEEITNILEEPQENMSFNEKIHFYKNTDNNSLTEQQLKEKRKVNILFKMGMARYNLKIQKTLQKIICVINKNLELLSYHTNPQSYIENIKKNYNLIKKELNNMEIIKRDAGTWYTKENYILNKYNNDQSLNLDEQKIYVEIKLSEDKTLERLLRRKLTKYHTFLLTKDVNFLKNANIVKNFSLLYDEIELMRIVEAFFYPSVLFIDQPGLCEILDDLCDCKIKNALITGGYGVLIHNFNIRLANEINSRSKYGNCNVVVAKDGVYDSFRGAKFSEAFPTYTYEDYLKYGASHLLEREKLQFL